MSDNREDRMRDAETRRNLEVNKNFQDLGEPIQKLLLQLASDVTNEEMKLFSKVTVRQLAKVYDMIYLEEDPLKILAWLKREALKAQGIKPDETLRRKKIDTGASRDAVAFYKELEQKNIDLMASFKKSQEERDNERRANIAERQRRREEAIAKAAADRERAAKAGVEEDAVGRLKKEDYADIKGTIGRFITNSSLYDNSMSNQDTEWWKKDEYRRDFEKHGKKGKQWTRVVEGGSQAIPDSEVAVREEWYRNQCWWKADKFRRDWLASREAEWWKEETYIRDWQDKDDKGVMWNAADEISGFNRKGHRRPAAKAELQRRMEWYKNNGPKGIVKLWCALSENTGDRCTLEEKRERDDYYKNGDWWKSHTIVRKVRENPAMCEGLRCAGAAAEDREWWKAEKYRVSFCEGGSEWKLATERAAVKKLMDEEATSAEQEKREQWYSQFWWKSEKFIADYRNNGTTGKIWKASGEEEAQKSNPKPCASTELRAREDWMRSCQDREWWTDEMYLRDWELHGAQGKKWTAGWKEAARSAIGDVEPAAAEELKQREEYYKNNWWKAEKFVKDYQANGNQGTVWKAAQLSGNNKDQDWWKQGEFVKEFAASRIGAIRPFWQSAEYVEDYWQQGAEGKMWIAANAAAGSCGKGNVDQATPEELQERERHYNTYWWRASRYEQDYAANGKSGKLWRAAAPDSSEIASPTEIRDRMEYFSPKWQKNFIPGFSGMLEVDAEHKPLPDPASHEEIHEREEYFKENWWKSSSAVQEDYALYGEGSKLLLSATPEVAHLGLSDVATYQASPEDVKKRIEYFNKMNANPEEAERDKKWWMNEAYTREHAASRDPVFWKNEEYIEDFIKNGEKGKKWTADNAATGSTGHGDMAPASTEELGRRTEWMKNNFWKSSAARADYEKNGSKGTVWTASDLSGKGQVAEGEVKARAAHFRPVHKYKMKEKPEANEKTAECDPTELLERKEWFAQNWWKAPEVKEEFALHGRDAKLFKAATQEVVDLNLHEQPAYQASPEAIEERAKYFETCGDAEWWKDLACVEDYTKHGAEGAKWKSRTFKESLMSMGIENPAQQDDLAKREEWFARNFWKSSTCVEDFTKNGNKGASWKAMAMGGGDEASPEELAQREEWFAAHATVDMGEQKKRKEWLAFQLTDEEKQMRRNWMLKAVEESRKIHRDELEDLLTELNDGAKPTEEQVQSIEKEIIRKRRERPDHEESSDDDGITEEEIVAAIAATNFYVSQTEEERLRAEQEALEALQEEEMNRASEEAAFLAKEAEEERREAGLEDEEYDVEAEAAAAAEEQAWLEAQEDAHEAPPNEDDVEYTAEDEKQWASFLENKESNDEELTSEQVAELNQQEEERLAAEAARAEAEKAVWESEEVGGDEGEEDALEHPADLDEDAKEELEAVVNEEGWGDDEVIEEVMVEEEPIDEMLMEEKGAPQQWKLPLREVTNPHFLKAYFTVIKYTPTHSFLGGKQKRIWVVDHFTRCFYNLEKSGKIKKEHAANKLLQLERNVQDTNRVRLMFFDAAHSYELQFQSATERERFIESASAIRPSIRVYAPDLTNPDTSVEACTTTIDGVGPESMTVQCKNAQGKIAPRELTGECKINASKLLTEPLTVWTGTLNLSGHRPPRKAEDLSSWLPRDKHDLYAIAVQEASFRKDDNEWFEYIQSYLGKDYLTLASMCLWDTMLIVLSRKKHLLKITNVEGSTKATVHKAVCGTKGGIGISLRYLETSICFVTCHLAARLERNAMRNTNLEEVFDSLQLGNRETDFCNQFNHVFFFGDFNYRVELDNESADNLLAEKNYAELQEYDQLMIQRRDEGILHGFNEPFITFAPTYRMQVGSQEYMSEKGNASSYCDRVMTRSMANTWVKCTSYKAANEVTCSEHQPVSATFIVRCVRPVLACFMQEQSPIPQFVFHDITFTESIGPIIKRPALLINSPFTALQKQVEAADGQTNTPFWNESNLPKLEAVTQCQEYIETCHIILIVREAAEKREDKCHRGTALITLFGRVVGVQDIEQEFESDVMAHGRCIGKLSGRFHWEPATLQ